MTVLERIGAGELHDRGVDGAGVGVAIIDTGVTPVAALSGRLRDGVDLSGAGTTEDAHGHGTAFAGLVAGGLIGNRPVGVAPGAHLIPVRVAGPDGATDVSNVLAAIQWVVSFRRDLDIRVLTLSFGTDSERPWRSDVLNQAVERAVRAGVVVVASVGNRGPSQGTVAKPADDPHIIAVGAARHDGAIAAFSSRGPASEERRHGADVLAPGDGVTTLRVPGSFLDRSFPNAAVDHQRVRGSSSSFATAIVAGAVTLLLQEEPARTPGEVRAALIAGAGPRGGGGRQASVGGTIDVGSAARWTGGPVPDVAGGVVRPTGLAGSRGSVSIVADDSVLDATTELTAQGDLFDPEDYASDWTEDAWSRSQWASGTWHVPRWHRRAHDQDWYGVAWGRSAHGA